MARQKFINLPLEIMNQITPHELSFLYNHPQIP